jgi:hypothetical protein
MKTYTLEDLKTKTLNEVSELFGDGEITHELAQAYVDLWNQGPHFTKAQVCVNYIRNFE